jgi:hypothetical protein
VDNVEPEKYGAITQNVLHKDGLTTVAVAIAHYDRRMAWGVQRGRRWWLAARFAGGSLPLKQL